MSVKWTEEQQKVIDTHGVDVLVSAAAGSGKTAVLVAHILEMVTSPVHPVDIDRLLVVTFTNAAAAEMRQRIRDALEVRAEQEADNEHLQRQLLVGNGAHGGEHGDHQRPGQQQGQAAGQGIIVLPAHELGLLLLEFLLIVAVFLLQLVQLGLQKRHLAHALPAAVIKGHADQAHQEREDDNGNAVIIDDIGDIRQHVIEKIRYGIQGFSSLLMIELGGSGTGSYPPLANGWQRKIRRRASHPPYPAPKRSIAVRAYSEHVGIKRQQGRLRGLTFFR